ncbi:MAG: GDSL-type esterase/lipase family protein [Caulobacteraceae bacterium]
MIDLRVCFLGDGFTLGTGDDDGLGWAGRVHAAERGRGIDLTSYNLGVRGQTGAEIAARAAREVGERIAGKGDRQAVVIAFGTNDIRLDRPVEESASALERVIRGASGEGYAVFVMGSPHTAEPELDALRALRNVNLEETARRLGAPYLDIRERVADWSAWHRGAMEGDGIHPGAEGYAAVAAVFAQWGPWRRWVDG